MSVRDFFTHYPVRVLWVGSALFFFTLCLSATLMFPIANQPPFPIPPMGVGNKSKPESLAAIQLEDKQVANSLIHLPSIEELLTISLAPPRPGSHFGQMTACLRLKGSQMCQCLPLPGRLDLAFQESGALCFAKDKDSSFWVDLTLDDEGWVVGDVAAIVFGVEQHAAFRKLPEISPCQKVEDFAVGSAFWTLAESKWSGADLVSQLESAEPKQRLEIGSNALEIGSSDWIAWQEGAWVKIKDPLLAQAAPIARIRSAGAQNLEWDAWEGTLHNRLLTPLSQNNSRVVPKIEELFGSLRIRSDKQMSCMLEKQCFILRINDWVLKENGRWHILRKKEEKAQLIAGEKSGELFVLDKIDRTQKSVKGRFFFAQRTQALPVELTTAPGKVVKRSTPSKRTR